MIPTFYLEKSGGSVVAFVANSDANNILKQLATGYNRQDAIKNARKVYFGNPRQSDKCKIVDMT